MNIEITSLIRKNIKKMKKYASAREEFSGKAKVFLDANENSFGSPADKNLNRYPDPLQKQLRDKISAYKGLSSPERLFLGNGSDEAIDLILRAFCEPRIDSLMLLPPTYGMYKVTANVNDIKILEVPLNPDFSLNSDEIIKVAAKEKPKVIFICSPNNPSANVYEEKDVERILTSVNSLVIIDEAYIHFADTPSWTRRLGEFNNLIVLQTFSKAWGLAGARLGMAFADPEIIEVLNKIKYPYNVSDCAAGTVMKALEDTDRKEKMVNGIKAERTYLMQKFSDMPLVKEVLPSQANFFLARFADPDAVYRFLTEEGIIVRNRSDQLHCEGCLRITIGTREQNDMLCEALNKYAEKGIMMKRILFIDRDGTIISEVPDETIDTMDKLQLLPGVIGALRDIVKYTDYELVMVSNQDGLGRPDFPEERFAPHNFLMDLLKNEGIKFKEVLIDGHYEEENSPKRKPNTGMLTQYMNADYDLGNSYVIGDRDSDVQLAKNLHSKAIFIGGSHPDAELATTSWSEIRDYLIKPKRIAAVRRKTNETDIKVRINIDGSGKSKISTGIGFLDHMLELFAKHSGIDCSIDVTGDLNVDEHHSIEDTGLALGEALLSALGNKRGIERYGFLLPMDESLAQVALDLSGRPYFIWKVELKREFVGEMPTEMVEHFFRSLSDGLRCNLHVSAAGENEHHIIEGIFKAFARSMKQACKITSNDLPSTKEFSNARCDH